MNLKQDGWVIFTIAVVLIGSVFVMNTPANETLVDDFPEYETKVYSIESTNSCACACGVTDEGLTEVFINRPPTFLNYGVN